MKTYFENLKYTFTGRSVPLDNIRPTIGFNSNLSINISFKISSKSLV